MTTYEELGMVKANESVIPADCLSFAEQAMYVSEFAQKEYNNLFEAVGIEELAVFESTGSEVIYEGAKLEAFKQKAKTFFHKIWAAIKAAYEKVYAFFIQKSKTAMEAVKGLNKADLQAFLKKEGNATKKYGTTHNFTVAINTYKEKMGKAAGLLNDVNKKFGDLDKKEDYKEAEEKAKEELFKQIFTTFGDKDSKSLSDIKKAIRSDLKEVEATGTWLASTLDQLVKIVKEGKTTDDLKPAYTTQKAQIDKCISTITGLKEENMKTASSRIMMLGKLSNALDVCANTYFDIFKKRFTEYLVILVRVWKDTKKAEKEASKEKKEKVNASVEYTSYNADMISEAFNW